MPEMQPPARFMIVAAITAAVLTFVVGDVFSATKTFVVAKPAVIKAMRSRPDEVYDAIKAAIQASPMTGQEKLAFGQVILDELDIQINENVPDQYVRSHEVIKGIAVERMDPEQVDAWLDAAPWKEPEELEEPE